MTIINNIEIDDIQYKRNIIKEAIVNNDPIENKLHVILCISNPCLYARRYILLKEMIQRLELEEERVLIYIVEYIYKKQRFIITDSKNPRHLQIRTDIPIWHKENMINMGVKCLLPKNWKAFAWIDGDIEFENPTWAIDTLKVLNGTKDIVQLFSHCVDMNAKEETMNIFTSFGSQFVKELAYSKNLIQFWHPGYAWACTRKAYEKMGGLYEKGILGSGDNIMALCLIQNGSRALNDKSTDNYKNSVLEFQEKVKTLRLGYVPGVIRHYYHGSKQNRGYHDRWQILLNHDYSPSLHIQNDFRGVLIPTKDCPSQLLEDIFHYFKRRNEDDVYTHANDLTVSFSNPLTKLHQELENQEEEENDDSIYDEDDDDDDNYKTDDDSIYDEVEDDDDEPIIEYTNPKKFNIFAIISKSRTR